MKLLVIHREIAVFEKKLGDPAKLMFVEISHFFHRACPSEYCKVLECELQRFVQELPT